jgi:ribonucleotide monophosphatase NagD (HAD superfamily)
MRRVPAFVFDANGVLRLGSNCIPGASKLIETIQSFKPSLPLLILSNGGGNTEAIKAQELNQVLHLNPQVALTEKNIILCHTPLKGLLPLYKQKPILIAGGSHCLDAARAYGFTNLFSIAEYGSLLPELVSLSSYPY